MHGGRGGGGAESRSFELIGASHEWGKSTRAGKKWKSMSLRMHFKPF